MKDRGNGGNGKNSKPNIVCIGGGTGQAEMLRGFKQYDCNITAIVAVTDSGRSTGVLRRNFNIPAPGDLRNCIVALSESEPLLKELFQHRFDKGSDLEGMSFGNLFMTALAKVKGNLGEAVKETSKILKIKGKVLPSTLKSTHLCAELEDGTLLEEEVQIVKRKNKSPIKRLFLKDNDVRSGNDVIHAIKKADIIVIGPGSLYTSVLVHFLIPNLKKAVKESKAKKLLVANLITQAGQTDGFTLSKHVEETEKYVGKGVIDYLLVNTSIPSKKVLKEYEKEGGFLVKNDLRHHLKDDKKIINNTDMEVIEKDIIKNENKKEVEWNKVTSLRHDPAKAARIMFNLVKGDSRMKAVILAAGNSTRMQPFSFSESKTMIHFLGKPLLMFHVEECISNGIDDITIICNPNNVSDIKQYFTANCSHRLNFAVQKEQRGAIDALISARKFLKDSFFLVKYGDSLSSIDETAMILETFNKDKNVDAVSTLRRLTKNENHREYGIAKFNRGRLVQIVEKPKDNVPSDLANVGIFILRGEKFFTSVDKHGVRDNATPQEYIFLEDGASSFWITEAVRLDVGRAWNLLEANKLLIERFGGKIESRHVGKKAKISETSYVSANSIISDDVTIEGYSSIDGYIGKGTKIKDSIIMKGSKIGKNCRIEASVIGKSNYIEDNFKTIVDGKDIRMYVKGRYVNPSIKRLGVFTGENVTITENIRSMPGKMVFPNKVINEDIKDDKIIRAILFDADNTIYATKNAAKRADMHAMRIFALHNKIDANRLYDEWLKIVEPLKSERNPGKRTRRYSYSVLAKRFRLKNLDDALEGFMIELINSIELMPNFEKIMPNLAKYRLAVFSEDTSDLTIPKLRKFDMIKKFDMIITADSIGSMKPSKEYYKTIFERFNVSPNECVVIGDSYEKDLKIAQEMGATTICYGDDKRANFTMKDYDDLPVILRRI